MSEMVDRYGREIPAGCKDVKLSAAGAWRTTFTHIQPGDVVQVDGIPDAASLLRAAPTMAPKRAIWVKVERVERAHGHVVLVMAKDWGTASEAPHTAITRKERPEELAAREQASADARTASVAESLAEVNAVTVTGARVHKTHVPCGRVYDGDTVSGVDTDAPADCVGCWGEPLESIAGDGTVITVGSRVLVEGTATVAGVAAVGTVTALGDCHEGVWTRTVTVRHDAAYGGQSWGYAAMELATYEEASVADVTGQPLCRVIGHGERDYVLVSPDAGDGIVTVRPATGGMVWSYEAADVYRADAPAATPPVQVCVCGMMPGARFHKRHCPAQEARGVFDTVRLAEAKHAARVGYVQRNGKRKPSKRRR